MPDTYYEKNCELYEAEAAEKASILHKAPFMGKWLMILFWIVISMNIFSVLTIDIIADHFYMLAMLGAIGYYICNILYGWVCWKLAAEERRYKTAAYCVWAGIVPSLINDWINGLNTVQQEEGIVLFLMAVVLITMAPVSLYGKYNFYMGHAEVLKDTSLEFSEKWKILWKWNIRLLIALAVSIPVMAAFLWLGFICMALLLAALMGLAILEIVYIYQMAKLFREYHI